MSARRPTGRPLRPGGGQCGHAAGAAPSATIPERRGSYGTGHCLQHADLTVLPPIAQRSEFLGAQGIPYEERDVSRDHAAAEEVVRRTGQMGVPVTAIGGEMVVGFDRPRLERIVERLRTFTSDSSRRPATLGAAVKDAPGGGALAGTVHPGTPAARGGLKPGDIIVAVEETPVVDADTLARVVQVVRARGSATLTVRRAGAPLQLRIPFTTL